MKTNARVELEVSITCSGGGWSPKATIEEIRRQAKKNAIDQLSRALRDSEIKLKVVGEPLVTVVTVED